MNLLDDEMRWANFEPIQCLVPTVGSNNNAADSKSVGKRTRLYFISELDSITLKLEFTNLHIYFSFPVHIYLLINCNIVYMCRYIYGFKCVVWMNVKNLIKSRLTSKSNNFCKVLKSVFSRSSTSLNLSRFWESVGAEQINIVDRLDKLLIVIARATQVEHWLIEWAASTSARSRYVLHTM